MWDVTYLASLFGILALVMLVIKAVALLDSAVRPATAYLAADKQKKPFWLIILGVATTWNLLSFTPVDFINLIGLVAAIVYLVDARPALRQVGRGRRSSGPYGPW